MRWQQPEFIDINMSAEIGGYQDEFEERAPAEPPCLAQLPAANQHVNED